MRGFDIVPGDVRSGVVLHVPHASVQIPPDVRDGIVLDDEELAVELDRMTDALTDELARAVASESARRPWLFVNRLSRLVMDPDNEPTVQPEGSVGHGAILTHTSAGEVLRRPDEDESARLIATYHRPYLAALAELVDERLAACGTVTLVDVHSYPADPLPFEDPTRSRPEVCIATHAFHTTPRIVDAVTEAFTAVDPELLEAARAGARVALTPALPAPIFFDIDGDSPYLECHVPAHHLGRTRAVEWFLLQLRRDVYAEGRSFAAGSDEYVTAVARAIDNLS